MRPPSSHGLFALCALFATSALALEPKAPPPPAASTLRTIQLGPEGTIQYVAEPGDERSTGTLSVLPMESLVEPPAAAQDPNQPAEQDPNQPDEQEPNQPAAQEPNQPGEEEQPVLSARAASPLCSELHRKLAVRLLQLRGLDVDEATAPWIWQRISVFGEELPLSALQSDSTARNLAIELAQCETTAGTR